MSTATKSRILLTTFIVLLGAVGVYFAIYGGSYIWFGWVLSLAALAALIWAWLPVFKK
jgi:hypothetical protein